MTTSSCIFTQRAHPVRYATSPIRPPAATTTGVAITANVSTTRFHDDPARRSEACSTSGPVRPERPTAPIRTSRSHRRNCCSSGPPARDLQRSQLTPLLYQSRRLFSVCRRVCAACCRAYFLLYSRGDFTTRSESPDKVSDARNQTAGTIPPAARRPPDRDSLPTGPVAVGLSRPEAGHSLIGASGWPACCGPTPPRPTRAVICGRRCGASAKRWNPPSAITSSPMISPSPSMRRPITALDVAVLEREVTADTSNR